MPIISSATNPRIKQLIRLKESRTRRQEGCFLIDGVREIIRAWESGFRFIEVYIPVSSAKQETDFDKIESSFSALLSFSKSSLRHQDDLLRFLTLLRKKQIPILGVDDSLFPKICFGDRNEGIIAIVESQTMTFDNWEKRLPAIPLIGVLENIEKPGNIGAVYRSADGAGLDGIILISDHSLDLFNPNIIRSSLGTLFRMPTVIASSEETIRRLIRLNIQIAAAICDSAVSYTTVDFCRPTAIVLGCESDGLTPIWSEKNFRNLEKSSFSDYSSKSSIQKNAKIQAIKLPMLGIADSLNISNAAAILFYEAQRQRLFARQHSVE
ncbi:MAG: TrmH family RNA methyltransferase [Planctomycetia bacterium]|nr:TrmH family RNA methyltransferase [Planctomycetia bacterium]